MKRYTLLLLMLLPLVAAHGQADTVKSYTAHSDDNSVVEKTQLWVRAHFFDNWYVQMQAGPSVYRGYDDALGPMLGVNPFRDGRLTWTAEAKIGRWVFPKLGYRFGIGTGNYHGFLRRELYDTYCGQLDMQLGHGVSQEGFTGYYWETDNPDLLIQRWKYYNLTGEMMIKLITVGGYNREQRLVPYLRLGVSFLASSYNDPERVDKSRFGAGINGGLGATWRIDEHWGAHVEAYADIHSGTFDREWLNGVELAYFNEDFSFHAFAGLEYRFNWRREPKRSVWEQRVDSLSTVAVSRTQYQYVFDYDTNMLFKEDRENVPPTTEFSPEMIERMGRRAALVADSLLYELSQRTSQPDDKTTLADILGKHMLPYEMIFFEIDKWDILSQESLKVARMARIIKSMPGKLFLLIGSADSKTGTVKRNEFLSVSRADVVYNQLVYEFGIDPSQLRRVYLGGILDYDPFELNRATVIILDHPKVLAEFMKLRDMRHAGGSQVEWDEKDQKR